MRNSDVPGTLYRRGEVWWYERNLHGQRLRVSTRLRDRESAVQWIRDGAFGTRTFSAPKDLPPRFVKKLLHQARSRAKAIDIEFKLTEEDFEELYEQANKHCSVSGLPFDIALSDDHVRRPYAPSIDRIDHFIGYTKSNCRIVCCAVNLAMNDFGERVLWDIAASMVELRRRKLLKASLTHNLDTKGR